MAEGLWGCGAQGQPLNPPLTAPTEVLSEAEEEEDRDEHPDGGGER